jgi:tetratricopeptide (TPR) repeat protein
MGRGIGLPVVITLVQGRFSAGTYRLKLSLEDICSIASGMSPDVLPLPVAGVVAVTLIEPVTDADRASASRQMGHAAQKRGQLEEAERHFRAAADLQAGATGGIGGMYDLGVIYVQRKKYREAIRCFERLETLKRSHGGISLVPEFLAQAYIGVGDDASATRALERAGIPDALLAPTLDRLRQAVSRRQ